MFPPIKSQINAKSINTLSTTNHSHHYSNDIIQFSFGPNHHKNTMKKIWLDEKPPESLEKTVYLSVNYRINEIERIMQKIDTQNGIDDQNMFHYFRNASFHLNRLKAAVGLNEIKSAKVIKDAIKIICYNIKLAKQMEKEKREALKKEEEFENKDIQIFVQECALINEEKQQQELIRKEKQMQQLAAKQNEENAKLLLENQANEPLTESENKTEENQQENISKLSGEKTIIISEPVSDKEQRQAIVNTQPNNLHTDSTEKTVLLEKEKKENNDNESVAEDLSENKNNQEKSQVINTSMIANGINLTKFLLKKQNMKAELEQQPITSDSLITPLLKASRKNLIPINDEVIMDTRFLEDIFEKTLSTLKQYAYLINEIEIINNTCNKYFCSFIEDSFENFYEEHLNLNQKDFNQSKQLLDSALKYQESRKKYYKFIERIIKSLRNINNKFNDGTTKGVVLEDFCYDVRKLADRYDADLVQMILIMPEYSIELKKCIRQVRDWIGYDSEYSGYISNDMKETDKKKKNLNSIKHSSELISNQLLYKIRHIKNMIEARETELSEMFKRRASKFEGEESVELTKYSLHRRINKYKLALYAHMDCQAMLEKVSTEIDDLDHEMLRIDHMIATSQSKMAASHKIKQADIDEKFLKLENFKKTVFETEDHLIYMYNEKKISQNELDVLENCYFKLKEIFINKTSSESLEKIFYGVKPSTFKMNNASSNDDSLKDSNKALTALVFHTNYDPFEVYFKIISKMLHGEWIKFYYILPFYPERGQETKKKDIDHVYYSVSRASSFQEQCYCSLRMWKRHHSRAKIENLSDALNSIGRVDIVNEINCVIKRMDEKLHGRRKRESIQIDVKKREADLLHQKLVNFFERNKNENCSNKTKFSLKFKRSLNMSTSTL